MQERNSTATKTFYNMEKYSRKIDLWKEGQEESLKFQIRRRERTKYNEHYFTNLYWYEDFSSGDFTHSKRFLFLADALVRSFPDSESVIDVGCGTGSLLRNLQNIFPKCLGTEVSHWALFNSLQDLKEKGMILRCGAERIPFESDFFDLVICSDILEHIPEFDALDCVRELIRIGKRNFFITINLHHQYKYHPTIRPRWWWETKFAVSGARQRHDLQEKFKNLFKNRYPEYDFFIYEKD